MVATTPVARPARLVDVAVFLGLLVVAGVVYGRTFGVKPFGEDNFFVMSWVDQAPASALARVAPEIYPEWRPLAYVTVWLQYRWSGLERMADYYVVNLLLWVSVAWVVYRIARGLTGWTPAAVAAGLFMLIDPRAIPSVAWIVERQNSMACLFGLLALWLVIDSRARAGAGRWAAVAVLLLASALSKEYGLAFAGAVVLYGLWERRLALAGSAAAAALVYAALRITFAGGATDVYCEDMGFFFEKRHAVCFDSLDAASLSQMIYNVGATAVGTLLPGLFSEDGRILVTSSVGLSAAWLAIAVAGWRGGPSVLRLPALVFAGNTALSFMLYQARNQMVAVCAVAIVVGVGVAVVRDRVAAQPVRRLAPAAIRLALVAMLSLQASATRRATGDQVAQLMAQDPCRELVERPEAAGFVDRVRMLYGPDRRPCVPPQ